MPRQHRGDMRIARIERAAELAIAPANAGEPALQRGNGQRRPARPALDAGGEIEADGLRVRGQGVETLTAQPGGEVPPVGVIGPLGVLRAGVAGVVAGLFRERREMGGGLGERPAAGLVLVGFSHSCPRLLPRGARRGFENPTPRPAGGGPKRRFAAQYSRGFDLCPISAHYRTSIPSDKPGGFCVIDADKAPPSATIFWLCNCLISVPPQSISCPATAPAHRPQHAPRASNDQQIQPFPRWVHPPGHECDAAFFFGGSLAPVDAICAALSQLRKDVRARCAKALRTLKSGIKLEDHPDCHASARAIAPPRALHFPSSTATI